MGRLTVIKLAGNEVWAEVGGETTESAQRNFGTTTVGERVLDATASLNSAICAYCASLKQAFQSIQPDQRPNKVTASFGLKLSGDAKFYLVNAAAEASLTIEAEWEIE